MDYGVYGGRDSIYIIDVTRGFNLWAVYDKNGNSLGQAKAVYIYPEDGGTSNERYAATFDLIEEGGSLKKGKTIAVSDGDYDNAVNYDSGDLRIGSGAGIYEGGGAVGYSFRYILTAVYSYEVLTEVKGETFTKSFALKDLNTGNSDVRFKVTYLPGEGSGIMVDPNEYAPGEEVTALPCSFTPPAGKKFSHYSAFGGLFTCKPGDVYNIPCNVTLTAIWKEIGQESPAEPDVQGPADAFADLILPPVSFEGHAVFARDASDISIDGEPVSLTRAYAEGLASNRFTADGADVKERQSYTETKLIYDSAGTYEVRLDVETDDAKSSDTESIEIKRTPSISAVLGGKQKENRKQTLDVTVAQNPQFPVTSLSIRITEPESGESINVIKSFSGAENAPDNSEHIKYRSLINNEIGLYYVSVHLEFLTKFSETRDLIYEINASDSRGNTDTASSAFTVVPDEAPNAAIDLASAYYRGTSSNIAKVTMRDASTTDGDQLKREWQVASAGDGVYGPVNGAEGFADDSFGSLLSVHFNKTGVGYFDVRLKVTDVWTEETLPEYISAIDYRSVEAYARSHVDNIPPEVLLSLKRAKTAEILLISKSRAGETLSKTEAEVLRNALLKDSIAADVMRIRTADPSKTYAPSSEVTSLTDDDLDVLRKKTSGNLFSFNSDTAKSSFWGDEGGNVRRDDSLNAKSKYTYGISSNTSITTDGIYLYRMRGTLSFAGKEESLNYYDRTYPFTLDCWDLFSGKNPVKRWSVSITKSVFPSTDGLKKARLTASEDSSYIILTEEGRSLIIDKQTGAFITTIGMEVGETVFEGGGNIYILKSDGIFRLSSSGILSCIRGLDIHEGYEKAAMVNGKLNFVYERGLTLYRGIFDPKTEEFKTEALTGSAPLAGLSSCKGYCIGADRSGRLAIWYDDGTVKYYEKDGSCTSLKAENLKLKGIKSVIAVRDGLGNIRGAAAAVEEHTHYTSGRSDWNVYVYYFDMAEKRVFQTLKTGSEVFLYSCGVRYPAKAYYEDGSAYITYGPDYGNMLYNLGLPETNVNYPAGVFSFDTLSGEASYTSQKKNQRFAARAGNLSLHKQSYMYEAQSALRTISFDEDEKAAQLEGSLLAKDRDYSYVLNVGTGFNGENAAKSIKEGGETLASLELKTQKASGSLSRTIELEPNRTYYYEYDTDAASDILSFSRTVTAAPGSSPRYAVAEEHMERFSKDSVSGFFTADAGGLSVLAGNGCYELGPDNAGISFSIPKGETAVLSFAYDYSLAAKTPEVSLSKGGKAYSTWNMLSCGEIGRVHPAGTYYHDALLGEGSYILYSDTKIKIDDLRIMAVEESTAAVEAGLRTLAKQSDISEGTGLKHVSGSFDTGLSTLAFDESKDAQIYTASPEGEYTSVRRTTNRKGGYTERLIYTLPQNMKAVYIRVNASQSAPRSAGDIYYYLDAARWENLEDEDDEVYIESRAVPKGKDSVSFSFKGKELVSAGGSGSSSIFSAVKRKGGALTDEFAQIDDIFMVFAKRSGSSSLTNGQFMVLGDEVLVPGASANDAVTMSFAPGKTGSTVISSLRIWFIEDGQRVYVNDTAFTDENYLTGWKAVNAYASVKHSEEQAKEQAGRVYRKGQTVLYSFSYYDYEADPEKEGFFRYTHEPMNDGLNPISGEILTQPISKFYIDGKYTVEHWVVDDAGRDSGTEDFDYNSNVASAVFYIEGNLPENEAPVVKKIRTSPAVLNEGDGYNILVTVDDPDGDILSVKTELYFEQGSKPVYTKMKTGVKRGSGGVYPELIFTEVPDAQEGDYEVVVTVSDGKNSGIGSYSFHVDLKRTLLGDVEHTEEWEANRQDYNFRKFKDRAVNLVSEYGKYRNQQSPRKRGKNVFWTGEALQLNAEVTGDVTSVTAKMSGTSYSAVLKRKGSTDIWTASMWESGMKGAFAKGGPEQKSIVFTARYKDGSTLTYTANIIFDDDELYWNLHRVN